ncbi:family 20 glycosylhydrolase [Pelomonas sp. SE-A7]|uniref:beta-N-acetylhexosaminidase n=1 Tax=Pelomonas sp. SE-A7 TaxID=3054953 RepID=UPI00259D2597|nr:family 20 glycosylhydrolase [Pelomonas sp. SE-A7]MDM4766202.1 family 20 glycosylhydrolase [Pelomonas sp. SE-A7]
MKWMSCLLLWAGSAALAAELPLPALIPVPVSMERQAGEFRINAATRIAVAAPELDEVAEGLAQRLRRATGFKLPVDKGQPKSVAANRILVSLQSGSGLPPEGYQLKVNRQGVVLAGATPAGAFRGVQTLLQLLPKEVEREAVSKQVRWAMPAVVIKDHPRFGWRGLMLDVSRHFFSVAEVKAFIDQMARYKFNLLHWHLTDDQGWRIEIKSLPRLTEVGAWRVGKTGNFGRFSAPTAEEPRDYGGFYTQEQVREIVAYAKARHIDVLPEIDMPGHSLAALAAYPELSCTPGSYAVNSGEQLLVWPPGGRYYGLVDNTLCPAKEQVYEFADQVFGELARLFPFDYLHMGGDETARNFWEKSEAIQALMAREQLRNLDEVQAYFVARLHKLITAHGKKMIGWDEILQGGLVPGAAVMSWRGQQGGIDAARLGHEVVMTPRDFVYIDLMQGDAGFEPPVYASVRLSKTYQFEPLPEGVDAKLVKGGQANLWTEQVYNTRHAQYMTWPRAFAVAEALWSPKDKRDWAGFVPRVEAHFQRFDEARLKYSTSLYDPIIKTSETAVGGLRVEMTPEIDGLSLYYSFDGSFPDEFYPRYAAPLAVPKDAALLRVIAYRDGKPLGRMITLPVTELRKRSGKP